MAPKVQIREVGPVITALLRQRHRLAAQTENDFAISDPAEAIEASGRPRNRGLTLR